MRVPAEQLKNMVLQPFDIEKAEQGAVLIESATTELDPDKIQYVFNFQRYKNIYSGYCDGLRHTYTVDGRCVETKNLLWIVENAIIPEKGSNITGRDGETTISVEELNSREKLAIQIAESFFNNEKFYELTDAKINYIVDLSYKIAYNILQVAAENRIV